METPEVNTAFLDLERELDLFERTVDGVHVWERVRFGLHRTLRRKLGLIGQAHAQSEHSKLRTAARMARSLVENSPFLAPSGDVLVWGHERRRQTEDGAWEDIYCDPLVARLDDVVYLEQPHEGEHRKPALTDDVRYLDFVRQAPAAAKKLPGVEDKYYLSAEDVSYFERVAERFAAEFGVELDVVDAVAREVFSRRVRLPLYDRIVRRVDPSVAVVVVSYGRETFVEACRRHDVPVVELQHGVVSDHHFGYAYPGDRSKRTFPDYLFTFGEFWNDAAAFPLPAERIVPVGYPYLERRLGEYDDPTAGSDAVVVLSQGTIGEELSEFAVDFAARTDREVVYKLHPGEYSRWRRDYPWLAASDEPNLRVADGESDLYDLFDAAGVQVGVYSTALYEGLAFGLDTYVVDLPGTLYVDRLVEEGTAVRVDGVSDLREGLDGSGPTPEGTDIERFFRRDGVENVVTELARIRSETAQSPVPGEKRYVCERPNR